MSRPYSLISVVRAVPRALLRRYCLTNDLPFDPWLFDDDAPATQVLAVGLGTPAFRPWFDGTLRHVHQMGTEAGTLALLDETLFRRLDLPADYHELAGPEARALWFLTCLPDVFHAARLLHAADDLPARHSTAVAGLPEVLPPHAPEDLIPFRRELTEYFQQTQFRGRRCHIDALVRGCRLLLFVYLDDYPDIHVGFAADDGDRLERRTHLPTFEVVFQFAAPPGTLSVYSKVRQPVRIELLGLFCRHLLGVEELPEIVRRPAFRLNHLLDREAVRVLDPSVGATAARVRKARVSVPGRGEWVTLETAPDGKWDDLHDMLDRHFPADLFPRGELTVSGAGVTVGYVRDGKARTLTFDVTRRGTTDLASRPDEQQDLGQRLLRAWRITDA